MWEVFSFRTLSRWLGFLTDSRENLEDLQQSGFPYPREATGGSYEDSDSPTHEMETAFSSTFRGDRGFLLWMTMTFDKTLLRFRTLPRWLGFLTKTRKLPLHYIYEFPPPLEVIGGSYKYWDRYESKSISGFPSPFEVTGVSYSKSKDPKRGLTFRFRPLAGWLGVLTYYGSYLMDSLACFRPLARRLGFLTEIKFWGEAITELFPYPPEVNGGSYFYWALGRYSWNPVSVPYQREWGCLTRYTSKLQFNRKTFPPPPEVNASSNKYSSLANILATTEFPFPLEVTGGSYREEQTGSRPSFKVSVPSRGKWGVLQQVNKH